MVNFFYAEHLGDDKYHFYTSNGGYLAVNGNDKEMAGIVVTAKAYENLNAPNNAEFRFIPTKAPTGAAQ